MYPMKVPRVASHWSPTVVNSRSLRPFACFGLEGNWLCVMKVDDPAAFFDRRQENSLDVHKQAMSLQKGQTSWMPGL